MTTREKLILAPAALAGASWAARALLRSWRWIELRDRVVVITGSDSGFGLVQARQAAAQGAFLVLAARNAEELEAAARALEHEGAREVIAVPTDVSRPSEAQSLIDAVIDRFGRIDVLINTAGLMLVGAEPTLTIDDLAQMMDVNFWGAVYTSRAALPHMRRARFGRIANVSSMGGRIAAPHMLPYTVSKFALTGYTKGLRHEALRDNIHVTGIYPTLMRTGGHRHAWFKGDQRAEYAWFSLGDVLPGLAMPVERAARQALRGIQGGDPEVIIGLPARLQIALEGIMPNWWAEFLGLIEKALPAPANLGAPAVQGKDIRSPIADFTNRMVPENARP